MAAKHGVRNPAHDLIGALDHAQRSGLTVLVDACSAQDEGQWARVANALDPPEVFISAALATDTVLGRLVDLGSYPQTIDDPPADAPTVICRLDAAILEVPGEARWRLRVDRDNGLTPETSLLLVDLGTLTGAAAIDRVLTRGSLARVPSATEWAGIILSGADPVAVGVLGGWSPRAGLGALRSVLDGPRPVEGGQQIGFVEPVPPRSDQSFVLHYATPAAWRCYSLGRPLHPRAATELAAQVVESRFYRGPGFSAGDAWLEAVAEGHEDPSDEHGWRLAELSHQVAQLEDDVRSLS